ncbi:MAG TPA: phosphoribosylaminoimidazolesuccinocarboxamide synthase [Tepidisphaeraceae bacterium]|nr:phosphoribosylaminoimidazolesuccinocarboxamide synthase [Tepidisphaeraceae bacterium]
MASEALLRSELPFHVRRGKVRDVYDIGEYLLIVATDRISAFDCVMPNGIPDKGKILTQLSLFWFDLFAPQFENHLIESDAHHLPAQLRGFADQIDGRAMFTIKADVIPIECVARGYLAGSGWKEYQKSGAVCGVQLPPGLKMCDKLPEPIFTPATKEQTGHDINVNFGEVANRVGASLAEELRERTLTIYTRAAEYALQRGIIIADTKFEFGLMPDHRIILIDEMLTPDSSRFWPADGYQPGREQASYDKQFVRDYLETLNWDKSPPAPPLPEDVVLGTRARYVEAFRRLTGQPWRD